MVVKKKRVSTEPKGKDFAISIQNAFVSSSGTGVKQKPIYTAETRSFRAEREGKGFFGIYEVFRKGQNPHRVATIEGARNTDDAIARFKTTKQAYKVKSVRRFLKGGDENEVYRQEYFYQNYRPVYHRKNAIQLQIVAQVTDIGRGISDTLVGYSNAHFQAKGEFRSQHSEMRNEAIGSVKGAFMSAHPLGARKHTPELLVDIQEERFIIRRHVPRLTKAARRGGYT